MEFASPETFGVRDPSGMIWGVGLQMNFGNKRRETARDQGSGERGPGSGAATANRRRRRRRPRLPFRPRRRAKSGCSVTFATTLRI